MLEAVSHKSPKNRAKYEWVWERQWEFEGFDTYLILKI